MKLKEGQYYYAPHRRQWGIWQWHACSPDGKASGTTAGGSGTFIEDCLTKEEARRKVFALNGWCEPKNK